MNRIKELRKQKNLSLKQLSSKLKESGEYLSADSLSKYERGVRNPKIENLEKLARYYEVTVDYLRGKSNKKHGASDADNAINDCSKVKFKMIEAYSKPELEEAVDEFLAGGIKLVDWKFNSYDCYYMFTCTYQELPSLD